jgi:hypothetical protein
VRSYRTVSSLPVFEIESSAVYFLWHFPSGCPDWLLASILLYGAPTFLDAMHRDHPVGSPLSVCLKKWAITNKNVFFFRVIEVFFSCD